MSGASALDGLLASLGDDLWLVAALVLIGVLLAVLTWLALGTRRESGALREVILTQQARQDEHTKHEALQAQRVEDTVRSIEHRTREEGSRAQQTLEFRFAELREQLQLTLGEHQTRFEKRHGEAVQMTQQALEKGLGGIARQLLDGLARSSEDLEKRVQQLTHTTDERLREISSEVDRRLNEGFAKTSETFLDIQKRLAIIDQAQQEITKLSSNVVSLQEVLSDKRSRGAFGEMQLNALVRNVMPEQSFSLQHTLSNDRIADCVLFLPPPTGSVAIDAKFPKESYDRMTDVTLGDADRREAERRFKLDIRKHIQDIAGKYILPGETADGAIMFIPAEAIFAEIHAHHTDLVEEAYRARVWLVSPTTLMAILNTARAVLKDEETRKQVHIIQDHLRTLARDFDRFRKRMDQLSRHIGQANEDVKLVHTSARKISSRFEKIERVEITAEEVAERTEISTETEAERIEHEVLDGDDG